MGYNPNYTPSGTNNRDNAWYQKHNHVRVSRNQMSRTQLGAAAGSIDYTIVDNIANIDVSLVNNGDGTHNAIITGSDTDYTSMSPVVVQTADLAAGKCIILGVPTPTESPANTFTAKQGLVISPQSDPAIVTNEWYKTNVAQGDTDLSYTDSDAALIEFEVRAANSAHPTNVTARATARAAPTLGDFASASLIAVDTWSTQPTLSSAVGYYPTTNWTWINRNDSLTWRTVTDQNGNALDTGVSPLEARCGNNYRNRTTTYAAGGENDKVWDTGMRSGASGSAEKYQFRNINEYFTTYRLAILVENDAGGTGGYEKIITVNGVNYYIRSGSSGTARFDGTNFVQITNTTGTPGQTDGNLIIVTGLTADSIDIDFVQTTGSYDLCIVGVQIREEL